MVEARAADLCVADREASALDQSSHLAHQIGRCGAVLVAYEAVGPSVRPRQEWFTHLGTIPAAGLPAGISWPGLQHALAAPATEEKLPESDVVRFLEMCVEQYRKKVTGYKTTLYKHERVNGQMKDPELIHAEFKEKPHSVYMRWLQGAKGLFAPAATPRPILERLNSEVTKIVAALSATLVKESRDEATFERIFNLYFLDLQALGEGVKKALGPEDPRIQDMLAELMEMADLDLDEMTELLLQGGGSEMEMAIRAGSQNAGLERLMYFLQVGYFSRRIQDQFDWAAMERDLEKIMQMLEAKGLDPGQLARIRNYLELRLEAFRRMIRQHVERELERRAWRQGEKLTREVLADKPLFALSPDEVAQMKTVVARLARKIKDALALRQRQEERGRLDTRRTIRKSLQYGGVPMEVFLKRRHRDKPKLITICDVSDSVRNASRFMLQLVWSLQECFSRVRSYVFVSEIAEVTQAFGEYPVERAIEWALKGAPVDFHCRSDFGYAFNRFVRTELERLDRRTTVMILGDARTNYNDPQAWALRMIRERVKGIIWLNPEGQWGWGIGDSVMPLYSPHCNFVRECRTIAQLGEAVDSLVHQWWRKGR